MGKPCQAASNFRASRIALIFFLATGDHYEQEEEVTLQR
jgi:hypothetical protein